MTETLKSRLEYALSLMDDPPRPADLARAAGVKPPSVRGWFSGQTKSLKGKTLLAVASALNVTPEWLDTGRGPMRPGANVTRPAFRVEEAQQEFVSAFEIPMVDAQDSCGGGSVVGDLDERPPLIKEPSWFQRYQVRPEDVFAVYADGESMADFIIDGDIVVFDRTKTEPTSGAIFLLEHPDGLKIKRMRRDINGSWILEGMNPDKRRFPDEVIPSDQKDLLKIRGRFVYRQGG